MDYIRLTKDNVVVLGALYKFEGELMNIVIKNPEEFQIGDAVTCDYNNVRFSTKILKKSESQLYVLVPQTYEQFPNEKRKHPRIAVNMDGLLLPVSNANAVNIRVVDLSRMGFGLLLEKSSCFFKVGDFCKIIIQAIEMNVGANLRIKNCEEYENCYRYGCEIQSMPESDEYQLRKFILAEQLKSNMIY